MAFFAFVMNRNRKGSALIGFTGDVMLGRGVNYVISQKGDLYPWGNMLFLLRSTDANVINLETTLTNSNRKVNKVFNFKASPDRVKALQEAGVSVASLANNHILDYSEEGLIETIAVLDQAGIQHVGAGINRQGAAEPVKTWVNDVLLGVIGFTDNEERWKAGSASIGTNFIDIGSRTDRRYALDLIRQLRPQVDTLVVSIHWGYNLQEKPSSLFVNFAHAMLESGADIIHGHSAHNFQAIERNKNKLIMYDTGDFVDDYMVDADLRNDHSFFYIVKVSKQGVEQIELVPVLIDNCQVNVAAADDFDWCIHRIQELSAPFGTVISAGGEVKSKQTH